MKTTKKAFVYIGIAITVLILIIGAVLFPQGRTVDCRGTVEAISYDESSECTYLKVKGVFDGPIYTIKVKSSTSIRSEGGDKMSVDEIKTGDVVSLDHFGKWKSEDSPLTAKQIKVISTNTT